MVDKIYFLPSSGFISRGPNWIDVSRVTDLKDRTVAEHNFERVNVMSVLYLVVLTIAGLTQV